MNNKNKFTLEERAEMELERDCRSIMKLHPHGIDLIRDLINKIKRMEMEMERVIKNSLGV